MFKLSTKPFAYTIQPTGPLVPQFYGYYVPDYQDPDTVKIIEENNLTRHTYGKKYTSPLLIMEDCGSPVNGWDLDEQAK